MISCLMHLSHLLSISTTEWRWVDGWSETILLVLIELFFSHTQASPGDSRSIESHTYSTGSVKKRMGLDYLRVGNIRVPGRDKL